MRRFSWIFILFTACAAPKDDNLTIACAANVEAGIDSVARYFSETEGIEVDVISGASGTLATQIREGAPYDIFISAEKKYTDDLNKEGLTSSSENYLTSVMVCVNHTDYVGSSIPDLLKSEQVKKIGIADPEVAPFGKAAKGYLKDIQLWDEIESKVVFAENISQLNMYIETKEVDAAFTTISYLAQREFSYAFIELDNHPESIIQQSMVEVVQDKPHPEVKKLHDFLYSEQASEILAYFGY
jgi:molybdate transport system substrate-binding protein